MANYTTMGMYTTTPMTTLTTGYNTPPGYYDGMDTGYTTYDTSPTYYTDWGQYTSDTGTPVSYVDDGSVGTDWVDAPSVEIPNSSSPGDAAYGWKYYTGGVAIGPDGKYYLNGELQYDPNSSTFSGILDSALKKGGDTIKKLIYKDGDPNKGINADGIITAITTGYKIFGGGDEIKSQGYDKPVPKYTAVRQAVDYAPDPNRRPGAAGRRYFSDTAFLPQGSEGIAAARQAAKDQATGIKAAAPTYTAPQPAPAQPYVPAWERNRSEFRQASPATPNNNAQLPAIPDPQAQQEEQQNQGVVGLAGGGRVPEFNGQLHDKGFVLPGDVVAHADPRGQANKERGLRALHQKVGVEAIRGPGDAMSDSIPTTIEGREPARVANGEAYVRPENVARMGEGDMDKGANRLHSIMNALREKRTGSTKQINPDNPQELRAAYGGQINYAMGGEVKRFNGASAAGSSVNADTTSTGSTVGYGTSSSGQLSPWVGEYTTNLLGEAQALSDLPYEAYTGQLTAGPSALESQAFAGASNLADTGYTPTSFTGGIFDTAAAQQYMNPYLSAALDPQMKEMARQAEIKRIEDAGRLTKAGAFGGGRQAIMESEGARNLLDKQRQALAEGYSTAYNKAMGQFNTDQGRRLDADKATEASRQYSADFSRQSLADLAELGKTQREIEQAGLEADKAQFEEERDWAYKMPQYLKDLLTGLPIGTTNEAPNTTGYSELMMGLADLQAQLKKAGVI